LAENAGFGGVTGDGLLIELWERGLEAVEDV
jgi:hypothetical protein